MQQKQFEFLDAARRARPMRNATLKRMACGVLLATTTAIVPLRAVADSDAAGNRFIPHILVSSTIPPNGGLNPYGIAFVPTGFPTGGLLRPGDVLVSNFNNNNNQQGTGTTIIKLTLSSGAAPDAQASVFFQGTPPLGLTTALGVLKRGFVVVGNVTTTDGTSKTVKAGPLLFIDQSGKVVKKLDSSPSTRLDGPWDLAISDSFDHAKIFVSNVLDGTVIRISLSLPDSETVNVSGVTQIASGYKHRTDPAALVLGPTGLVYDREADALYVASTADNAIYKVQHAGSAIALSGPGQLVFKDPHLRGPLALAPAPNGHLLTSNGDAINGDPAHPSEIVEFTQTGHFVGEYNVHQNQGGAFGVATSLQEQKYDDENEINRLAVVNDNANDLSVTTFVSP